jgi:hypothetical protein
MTAQILRLICPSTLGTLRLMMLGSLAIVAPLLTAAGQDAHEHGPAPARLVQVVRENTERYINVNNATAAGYHPLFGCVSGPDQGAMGVHYINLALVGDGMIDETRPEALIYEPVQGKLQLVGVEYIVDSATWLTAHPGTPPMLEGQAFQFIGSPNRYALAPFFELHVWAWRDNPNGAFVDWNTKVSCQGE